MSKLYSEKTTRPGVRRCITACMVGGALLFGQYAGAASFLTLHMANGSKTSFVIEEKPHISFSDSKMHIRSNELVTDYDLASVAKFTFDDLSNISSAVSENEVRFTYLGTSLSAAGLTPGETVMLATIDGRIALTANAHSDGSLNIDLSHLQPGIYIVACKSSKNFKIKI
ncbi:MAG: hypothetical protein NC338_00635 [Firmicutes bacterium]|nr:hypothetical protein [Bacillota bacterium]MCM1400626.1 hypothetical protein [Bacteroides sp.]MCM1477779.1 hypothetical protein [Bacteroides sp.]